MKLYQIQKDWLALSWGMMHLVWTMMDLKIGDWAVNIENGLRTNI